ncbi:hypothetical protein ESCO_004152 [Escovopsis weberi]|uniref:Uncharacterized protein n=1 Tax=Escovopsis weberi TaxID=150374 RepID=A0A0M9VVI9_ESCWE|nr:hypothetical protein ESCO_004152 [Escovopsis weberi]
MPHIHLHEVFTACAHARFLDTISIALHPHAAAARSSASSSASSSADSVLQHLQSVLVYHEAVFKFGWCPACVEYLSSPRCRQGRPPIALRSAAVLRSYWRYKALNHMDFAVPAYEIPYSAYQPPLPSSTSASASSSAGSLADYPGFGDRDGDWARDRDRSYAVPFGESTLVWEERALWRTVRDLKPQQVHLGPLLFRLPILEDGLRNMLRGARQWTILWAKGDEALYRKDPGLDLNRPWDPAEEEAWKIERFYQPYRPLPKGREYLKGL